MFWTHKKPGITYASEITDRSDGSRNTQLQQVGLGI